jgi:hypothetical protein
MLYQVFLVESLGAPRNHRAIFVETNAVDGSRYVFHVKGGIQRGMDYEAKQGRKPEESLTFVCKSSIGWVDAGAIGRINEVCCSIPPPKKQFDGPKRLYPGEPLRRCQEWTHEAVQALRSCGVLQTAPPQPTIPPSQDYWVWNAEYNQYYHDNGDGAYEWAGASEGSSSQMKTTGKGRGKRWVEPSSTRYGERGSTPVNLSYRVCFPFVTS